MNEMRASHDARILKLRRRAAVSAKEIGRPGDRIECAPNPFAASLLPMSPV
jgi:hypothetical protein